MNKVFYAITIGLMVLMCLITFIVIKQSDPQNYPIVDKYEHDGKCYVEIVVEISPEEYIGYDVGDEYERRTDD